ncbi:MAG: aminomethyl-transferring glycine dehydrogenase [Rikenellaceae bacterium]|jgi:glycine dehydrogenase|nr:aminomethyl-transferring glycine dehydrogenase [Rikenellaceae bacterium]
MPFDSFVSRLVGSDEARLKEMLATIGVGSEEELIAQVVPQSVRLKRPLGLPAGMSEWEFAQHIGELAAKNRQYRSFIGMGYYPTATPAAIMRGVLENPAWYTPYTPYQAEISQGRLEALLNFQTMVCSLTGMEIAGCSLLDEATAAAEAMTMLFSLRSREAVAEGRNIFFVDEAIFPQTLDVLLTRSEPYGIEIVCDSYDSYGFSGREFGVLVQYPAASGELRDYEDFAATAHARGALVACTVDLMSLALLREPGAWGADAVVGSTQRFGLPMGFGGPHAAFIATRESFKRSLPGRIIGVSVDRLGNRALRMALQTREQHIKREKATSNICTAQALTASMAGFFAVYHGAEGLRRIASHIYASTTALASALRKLGCELRHDTFFDTLEIETDAAVVRQASEEKGINLFYPSPGRVHLSLDELTTPEEIAALVEIFAQAMGTHPPRSIAVDYDALPAKRFLRTGPLLTEEPFRLYRSETSLMRYIRRLEKRDISLADGMIPLGSCTMKLNAAATMTPLSFSAFGNIHPFAPLSQAEGYMEMIASLEHDLAVIAGLDATSLQPNSGAAGEYAGLMVVRAYHQGRGQGYRNVALIPASAHGTNPASAAMAGMKIVVAPTDERGNVDVDQLRARIDEHASELACLMITYPSTHGIFEERIREIVDAVHDAGGLVYMDGANMNAQVGLTNPGYIGADLCHLNLHKTFGMPHGGGGPGVGPICVAKHLAPFLPSHPLAGTGGESGITSVASAPYGSAILLPITYGYIKMLGENGLRAASVAAIVNANYIGAAIAGEYSTLYVGERGRVGHELILDLRNFRHDYGVDCADVARRLMDYGFHAPTLSFPIHDTFMVEPTESESKADMDRFIEALVAIKRECEAAAASGCGDNLLVNAPHTAAEIASDGWAHPYTRAQAAFPLPWVAEGKFFPHVSRIDAGYGDRNLVCTWIPEE